MEVHEIIGGVSDRSKSIGMTAMLLFLCPECHGRLGSRPNQESLVSQMAWKLWADPDNYTPEAVIRLWRPKCTEAFLAEVLAEVAIEYANIRENYQ
jgi:hypothetical protein